VRFAWLAFVSEFIGTVLIGFEIDLLRRIERGDGTEAEVDRLDAYAAVYSVPAGTVVLVAFVLALVWIYRVNRNAWVLRPTGMKFRPGWSVAWCFIPFANLVQPYRIMGELWRANMAAHDAPNWRYKVIPSSVFGWWIFTVVSIVSGSFYRAGTNQADSIPEYMTADGFFILSSLTALVMWYRSIRLVREIQAGQNRLATAAVF